MSILYVFVYLICPDNRGMNKNENRYYMHTTLNTTYIYVCMYVCMYLYLTVKACNCKLNVNGEMCFLHFLLWELMRINCRLRSTNFKVESIYLAPGSFHLKKYFRRVLFMYIVQMYVCMYIQIDFHSRVNYRPVKADFHLISLTRC
jgi:hypothetical protein